MKTKYTTFWENISRHRFLFKFNIVYFQCYGFSLSISIIIPIWCWGLLFLYVPSTLLHWICHFQNLCSSLSLSQYYLSTTSSSFFVFWTQGFSDLWFHLQCSWVVTKHPKCILLLCNISVSSFILSVKEQHLRLQSGISSYFLGLARLTEPVLGSATVLMCRAMCLLAVLGRYPIKYTCS